MMPVAPRARRRQRNLSSGSWAMLLCRLALAIIAASFRELAVKGRFIPAAVLRGRRLQVTQRCQRL